MSYRDILESELQQFQIVLDLQQKETLVAYCDELTRWNRKMNLTGLAGAALVRRLVVEPVWVGLQLKSGARESCWISDPEMVLRRFRFKSYAGFVNANWWRPGPGGRHFCVIWFQF